MVADAWSCEIWRHSEQALPRTTRGFERVVPILQPLSTPSQTHIRAATRGGFEGAKNKFRLGESLENMGMKVLEPAATVLGRLGYPRSNSCRARCRSALNRGKIEGGAPTWEGQVQGSAQPYIRAIWLIPGMSGGNVRNGAHH